MTKEHETLRSVITSIVRSLGSTVTHETLNDYCSKLGLNVTFERTAISKADRLLEIVENTPDESLAIVGCNLLEQKLGIEKNRFALEALLWKPRPEISNRCKREIAQSLEIDELYRDSGTFIRLLSELFITYSSSGFSQWMVFSDDKCIDLDEVEQHVIRNPGDWSVEYLWVYLHVYDLSSFRFSRFLEGLSHGDIQNCVERQKKFVCKVNTRLRVEGLELREVGTSGGIQNSGLCRRLIDLQESRKISFLLRLKNQIFDWGTRSATISRLLQMQTRSWSMIVPSTTTV